ncbi:MAG: hypothetical protein CVV64_18675 [Candidatus Wallbacteria bacterium HGW-Wallbacteria-1]|jgi:hypothetical protein|uniref:DUF4932 domain-containing protein n=1 Tax=Candidatus Wallbacteria bacterium HGW-Wallbacteria-1 TaxID=2013854 RepID=A0A2N1PJF8_9BACT|nr:MAG: hypothetical protein CVV64_18675 [Candidatus Wallbacteria bacterium HGW-Wallbacteria-1]
MNSFSGNTTAYFLTFVFLCGAHFFSPVCCNWSNAATGNAATGNVTIGTAVDCNVVFKPDAMVSFAHFLMGVSKVMPVGSSFSPEVFAYFRGKRFESESDGMHIRILTRFMKAASEKCSDLHDFELKVYHTALGKKSVFEYYRNLIRVLNSNNLNQIDLNQSDQKEFRRSFLHLYRAFQTSLSGSGNAVGQMMKNIETTEEYAVFRENLNLVNSFLAPDRNITEIRVVPVFLHVGGSDVQALRAMGISGVFGLNLDQLQVIELPLIDGMPVVTLKGLSHLYAVTLHEICHYYYYRSSLCSKLVEIHAGNDRKLRHLLAEALATALGNGLYFTAMKNEDPQWYADPAINGLAHRIIPLIQSEMEKGNAIGEAFMKYIVESAAESADESAAARALEMSAKTP